MSSQRPAASHYWQYIVLDDSAIFTARRSSIPIRNDDLQSILVPCGNSRACVWSGCHRIPYARAVTGRIVWQVAATSNYNHTILPISYSEMCCPTGCNRPMQGDLDAGGVRRKCLCYLLCFAKQWRMAVATRFGLDAELGTHRMQSGRRTTSQLHHVNDVDLEHRRHESRHIGHRSHCIGSQFRDDGLLRDVTFINARNQPCKRI